MILLKDLLRENDLPPQKGFNPVHGTESIGKFVVVYVIANTVVKGTRKYETFEKANQMATFINKNVDNINDTVTVKQIY